MPGAVLWDHTKHTALVHQTTNFPHFFPLLDDMGHDIWGGRKFAGRFILKLLKIFKNSTVSCLNLQDRLHFSDMY